MIDPLIPVRAIHLAASLLAAGTVCFTVLVADPAMVRTGIKTESLRRRLDVLSWSTLTVAVPTGAAWLVLVATQVLAAPLLEVCLHGGVWSVVANTRFGLIAELRLVAALGLAALIAFPRLRWLQLATALTFVGLIAWVGHAGATEGIAGDLHLTADIVHLAAAGVWLGGLPAFALVLWAARGGGEPGGKLAVLATHRFSLLGVAAVAALLITGIVSSWNLLAGVSDLVATRYGQVLLAKIVLFLAMVGIAAANRFRLTPRLPATAPLRHLIRNSLAECILGLGVLTAVGALGIMEPGAHAGHDTGYVPPDAAFVHIHFPEIMAEVTVDPGHAGHARASIRVMHEDGTLYPAKVVELALDPPKPNAPAAVRRAVRQPDGTWLIGDVVLERAGIWGARVIVTPEGKEPMVLDAPIVIER